MEFGKILRVKRESKGLTQEDVAKRLGVGKQLISSYETGCKIPPMRIVVATADLFRCSVDEMIGRQSTALLLWLSNWLQNTVN
ncbi:MAG: helix-turn-helix domain-containing protein [Oscillospiraceae bacterium]